MFDHAAEIIGHFISIAACKAGKVPVVITVIVPARRTYVVLGHRIGIENLRLTVYDIVRRNGKRSLPITKKEQRINKENNKEVEGDSFSLTPSVSDNSKLVKDKSRGTAFTLETLPDDWKEEAEKLAPNLDPEKLFEEFADYWKAVPGQRGRKKDWLATFRNHIRNLPEWKRKNFTKSGYSSHRPETLERDFSKIDYGESGLLSDLDI